MPSSSESGDALQGRDQASSEIHSKAVIEWVGKYTSSHDQARLDEYLQAVYLEAVDLEEGATGAETLHIGYPVIVGV